MNINDLYEATCNGNEQARHELFRTLSVRFRLVAYRMLRDEQVAEDIAQDSLLIVINDIDTLKVTKSFSAWAYTVLRNTALRHIEQKKRRRELLDDALGYMKDNVVKISDYKKEMNIIRCLRLLAKESPIYLRALNLKHKGFTTEEICDKLKVKPNYLYQIYHRARVTLKACIDKGNK